MKVLVIKPSSIGDVLHTFPAVTLLRAALPELESLSWVVNDTLQDVVALCPGVDKIIPFPRATATKPGVLWQFLKSLREDSYDVILDFQGLLRSGLMTRFARGKIRGGFANAREGATLFYNRKVQPANLQSHAIVKNLELVRGVLDLPSFLVPPSTRLVIPDEAACQAEALLPGTAGHPVLAVCFSSRWPSKNWSPDFLAEVLLETRRLLPGLVCWLLGSKQDIPAGEGLAAKTQAINLAGKTTLATLAALLLKSQAVLTVDSGPMHLAAACNIPCVSLFGSTNPTLTGPYGPPGFHEVVHSLCPQSPCMQRLCPRNQSCSLGVKAENVAKLLSQKLQLQA